MSAANLRDSQLIAINSQRETISYLAFCSSLTVCCFMTLQELQRLYSDVITPEDLFVLLSFITKKEKSFLLAHPEHEISSEEESKIQVSFDRRSKREPVAYITGQKEFYGRDFMVTKDTLIPRPETEHMIEEVLSYAKSTLPLSDSLHIVDVGTGSGNIIITLASEMMKGSASFFGIDISKPALDVARANALTHGVDTSITFLQSDLLKGYIPFKKKDVCLIIVANLPYLSHEIYNATEKDVRAYEPKSALVSDEHGLTHYYRLLEEIQSLQKHNLAFFFEISPEQTGVFTKHIRDIFPELTLSAIRDLGGRERLIKGVIS